MRRTRTSLALATAATVLMALTGCSGSDGDGAGDADSTAAPDKTKEGDAEDDADGTDTDAPSDGAPADDAAASAGAGCLEGSWESDMDAQIESMRVLLAESGLDAQVTVTGTSTTTYDAGHVITTYDHLTVTSIADLDGRQYVSTTAYDGVVTSLYTATDTEVVLTDVDAGSLVLTIENTLDGTTMDTGDYVDSMMSSMKQGGTMDYTCSGDVSTMVPAGSGIDMSAYATTLHRL